MFSKPNFASWLLLLAVTLLIYFKFVAVLFLAVTLGVVCRPLYEALIRACDRVAWMRRRPRLSHGLASTLTQLLACALVLLSMLLPLWALSNNQKVIVKSAAAAYGSAREWSRDQIQNLGQRLHIQEWNDFDELPAAGSAAPEAAGGPLVEQNMQNKVVEMVSHPAPFLSVAWKTLGGGAMLLGQAMFFFMALHFLLLHGPGFWRDVVAASPKPWRPTFASLSHRARTVLMATCVVHGLSAVSAFVLALPVFWLIVGAKHFVLMAMLAGFFQFIPLLGSATLVSLMTLYFFASGSLTQAWECLLLAFPLIVGLPDFWVRPYLAERYGKVHSLTMLAGFVTGFEVFGILGFVAGPLFFDLVVQFTKQVLGEKKAPLA